LTSGGYFVYVAYTQTLFLLPKVGGIIPLAYKITDECLMCGACEEGCPNGAISEGEDTYVGYVGLCLGV